jgi:hypothetical protein
MIHDFILFFQNSIITYIPVKIVLLSLESPINNKGILLYNTIYEIHHHYSSIYNIVVLQHSNITMPKRVQTDQYDTVSTVMGYLFLPTGLLQATGTRPSSTHI